MSFSFDEQPWRKRPLSSSKTKEGIRTDPLTLTFGGGWLMGAISVKMKGESRNTN